jgi:hypothetical protein
MAEQPEYDMMIHLVGEQPVPNLIAMRQFEVPKHLLIATEQTARTAENLKKTQPNVSVVRIDNPYDIARTTGQIEGKIKAATSQRPVFNLTGGTKMMFAAALDVARSRQAPSFYVETRPAPTLHWLEPKNDQPLKPVMRVDDFFRLAGHGIQDPGVWDAVPERQERVVLTQNVWKVRNKLGKFHGRFSKYESPKAPLPEGPSGFQIDEDSSAKTCTLTVAGQTGHFSGRLDLARYLGGCWFEEFCYALLKPMEQRGVIQDLRFSLKPAWTDEQEAGKEHGIQECDLVFTDGFRLYIIECKAGSLKQEYVQVLENNARKFGGTMTVGVLLAAFPVEKRFVQRIESSQIAALAGWDLEREARSILRLSPGTIIGAQKAPQGRKPAPGPLGTSVGSLVAEAMKEQPQRPR